MLHSLIILMGSNTMQTVLIQLTDSDISTLISDAVNTALSSNPHPKPEPTQEEDKLLSQEDVARLCQCTRPTIISWVKKGYLPEMRIGRRVLYSKSAVLKVMTRGRGRK